MSKRKVLELGGVAAGVILVTFGIVALVMGFNGRNTVYDNLKAEQITFGDATEDPAVPAKYSLQLVDNGDKARAFAQVMREHTLEQSGGLTYAQMGRFVAAAGKGDDGQGGTSNAEAAAKDPTTGEPIPNPKRNTWVTETALSTALNLAYTAEKISLFGMVVGTALLLSGIGFLVLALGGALRRRAQVASLAEVSPRIAHPAT